MPGSNKMRRWKRAAQWAWIIALVGLWALRLSIFFRVSIQPQEDFASYLAAATALRLNPHAHIYDLSVIAPYGCGLVLKNYVYYVYPPLLAMLLVPFTLVPCGTALSIWLVINLALWLALVVILLRYLPRHRALVFPLGLFFVPMWNSLFYGQIGELILLGMVVALWLVERTRPGWAGVVLGLLAAIKLYPALLILYFVLRRQWRLGIAAGLTVLVSGLAMTVVVGVGGMQEAAHAIASFHLITDRDPFNIALLRLSPLFPPLLAVLAALFVLAVARYQDGERRLGYAWALTTMVLVLPLIWDLYFIWLLPVFAYMLSRRPQRLVVIVLAVIYLGLAVVTVSSPWLTLATVVPLWALTAYTFLASSRLAVRDALWLRRVVGGGARAGRAKVALRSLTSSAGEG